MKMLLLWPIWALANYCAAQTPLKDPAMAFARAISEGKNVLLVFSGSDWCVPCIQFEKKVLRDSQFVRFADDRLVVLVADFPQKKAVPHELRVQYDSLAASFDPSGTFPQIVLLNPNRRPLGTVYYFYQSAHEFISQVEHLLKPSGSD